MTNPTFTDALDWLAEREGEQVYIEVGMRDPTLEDADFYPIAQHVTLGKIDMGYDIGHEGRGIAYIRFAGASRRDRLYIDQARVTDGA